MDICICITDSPCCTPETNTTLKVGQPSNALVKCFSVAVNYILFEAALKVVFSAAQGDQIRGLRFLRSVRKMKFVFEPFSFLSCLSPFLTWRSLDHTHHCQRLGPRRLSPPHLWSPLCQKRASRAWSLLFLKPRGLNTSSTLRRAFLFTSAISSGKPSQVGIFHKQERVQSPGDGVRKADFQK